MSTTESPSHYQNLEKMATRELLENINREDRTVADAVALQIPNIERLVELIVPKMKRGGRIFYIGAGTSGRLGIVDASECPPTYGVPHGMVVGIMAGGDEAIRKSVEFAEDDYDQAWKDLETFQLTIQDTLIGIAASGRTPYVVGGLKAAQKHQMLTACITCNEHTAVREFADVPIEVIVGPEFVTGSTRMKAGTAQKLVLNMISTSVMVKLGKVKGNKMVDMQLSNTKLVGRGIRMVMEELGVDEVKAKDLLAQFGGVRKAIDGYHPNR